MTIDTGDSEVLLQITSTVRAAESLKEVYIQITWLDCIHVRSCIQLVGCLSSAQCGTNTTRVCVAQAPLGSVWHKHHRGQCGTSTTAVSVAQAPPRSVWHKHHRGHTSTTGVCIVASSPASPGFTFDSLKL